MGVMIMDHDKEGWWEWMVIDGMKMDMVMVMDNDDGRWCMDDDGWVDDDGWMSDDGWMMIVVAG